jgi:5S rRNA maturation endonuclease (ribonuclease M5)
LTYNTDKIEVDVLSLLEDNNIPFRTEGKNVTSGWVEISCPHPGCSDPSSHCGVNLESGYHHCWICGGKGGMLTLTKLLLDLTSSEARSLLKKYPAVFIPPPEKKCREDGITDISLSAFDTILPNLPRDYLAKRGFDPDEIQRKYSIRFCYTTGKFAYRIIIPIIQNGHIVNFTARDVTGKQEPKYKNLANEEAVIPMKNCLYNIDTVNKKAIICEGVTDVWRIGRGAIATMGTEYTSSQLELLMRKKLNKVFVMYDADAAKKSEMLANALTTFIPSVEIVYLDQGDPGEMSEKEISKVLETIRFD